MKKVNYEFKLNSNPSQKDVDAALAAVYELVVDGASLYKYQCPVNYEELGAYVFNRILKMLCSDAIKGGLEESWQNGMKLWMSKTSFLTVRSYVRFCLSSGFIDYTRSFYSEFKHQPTDAQEKMFIFDKLVYDEDKISMWDLQQAFALLSTKERKSIYTRISRCKNKDAEGFAGFSAEFGDWFESISSPEVLAVSDLEDLTTSQVTAIRNGRLAYKYEGTVWYNILSKENEDKTLILSPF